MAFLASVVDKAVRIYGAAKTTVTELTSDCAEFVEEDRRESAYGVGRGPSWLRTCKRGRSNLAFGIYRTRAGERDILIIRPGSVRASLIISTQRFQFENVYMLCFG